MSGKIHTMFPTLASQPPVAVKAEGARIWDNTGKEYLDCSAGVCVVNIGHGVKEIADAVYRQMQDFSFVYRGQFAHEPLFRASKQIIELAPPGMERVFFCSGGSEASESALKIARQYHVERGKNTKHKIISKWQSYHGNTLQTLSIGGRAAWRHIYDPYMTHNLHIAQCNCYHCPFKMEYPSCGMRCAYELERTIRYEGADTISCFITELVSGATGCAVAPPREYYQIIRDICTKYDILMIVDEVITGFGRTGHNFASDYYGIVPDLIITAKGMGSGYVPVASVIVHEKIVDAIEQGTGVLVHSYTYASHANACAGVSAVLTYMKEKDLIAQVGGKGKAFKEKLMTLRDLPMVGDIRGVGLMLGIAFVQNKETRESYPPERKIVEKVHQTCFERGLMILPGTTGTEDGIRGDAILITPPFIITEEQMDKAVSVLREVIPEVYEQAGK